MDELSFHENDCRYAFSLFLQTLSEPRKLETNQHETQVVLCLSNPLNERQMNAVIHFSPFPEDRRSKSLKSANFSKQTWPQFSSMFKPKQITCPFHRVLSPPSESPIPGRIGLMNMARP